LVLKRVELTGTVDGRMALTPSSAGMGVASFSPDGRWIAYQRYARGTQDGDIHLISADGSADRPLVTDEGNDRLLGWVPDGSGILFHTERDARPGIWRLAVRNGSAVGRPEFVRDEVWGMEPMGMGEKGLYYMVRSEAPQVYTAEVDFDAGEIVSVATPVRDPGSGNGSGSPAWAPDGRQLAYRMWLQGEPVRTEIAVRSLETGDVRSFVLNDMGVEKIAWGSDPLGLLMHATRSGGETGVYRLDLQSGEVAPILVGDEAPGNLEGYFKRDGRTVAVPFRRDGEGITGYRVRDLETGREMEIETGGWSWIVAFPGGESYAVWTEKGLRDGSPVDATLSVVGVDGSRRTLWRDSVQGRFMTVMAITSDGEHVLVAPEGRLMIVDVATGDHRFVEAPSGEVYPSFGAREIVIQPNGSRIAFPAGKAAVEIWLIEGLR
ncbi:MAG TPA: hypothetical protein VLA43_11425, partial [Longimicrobiales bacterium]|nr:hypothetical protein [Longimicrobiales bacterium]